MTSRGRSGSCAAKTPSDRSFASALVAVVLLSCWGFSHAQETEIVEVSRTGTEIKSLLRLAADDEIFDDDETLTWKIYVPPSYDPAKAAGLLVFVSPTRSSWMQRNWAPLLEEKNLIWISAESSGNYTLTNKRILLTLTAPYLVEERYSIDPDRIYVAGFSGGGKVASLTAPRFANLFRGAIYICGVEFWSEKDPERLSLATSSRYVFVTGTRDFNRVPTKRAYDKYLHAGMTHSKLMVVKGMEHATPDAEHLREAIDYLDQRD